MTEIVQNASDWLLLDSTSGVTRLDVRTQARTEAGDLIYLL